MARRRSAQTAVEGRYIAARILDAKRRGYTNKIIADSFGINERTVRKIVSGETSGRRTYARQVTDVHTASRNVVNVKILLGYDNSNQPIIKSTNIIARARDRSGNLVAPTPFDVLRLNALQDVAQIEGDLMQQRYGAAVPLPVVPRAVSMSYIERPRKRATHEIVGQELRDDLLFR